MEGIQLAVENAGEILAVEDGDEENEGEEGEEVGGEAALAEEARRTGAGGWGRRRRRFHGLEAGYSLFNICNLVIVDE